MLRTESDPAPDEALPLGAGDAASGRAESRLAAWRLALLLAALVLPFAYFFLGRPAAERTLPGARPTPAEAALVDLARDPRALAEGAEIFRTSCSGCHGPRGEGALGPNLTDRHWIHSPDPAEILRGVREGYLSRGMPAWEPILGPERARRVAAFVLTLRGKDLAGRGPEGEIVE